MTARGPLCEGPPGRRRGAVPRRGGIFPRFLSYPLGEVVSVLSYFSDLRYREVIDIHTGFRLGYICDAEFDDEGGRICSLITPGKAKLFGLLGREDDFVLPWESIVRVGRDIILVDCKEEFRRRKRARRF